MQDLFAADIRFRPARVEMAPGAVLLCQRALPMVSPILEAIAGIAARSPFRRMTTRGGFVMGVEMTNCGTAGWISDRKGYRYQAMDPLTQVPWPMMPPLLQSFASTVAGEAGFDGFVPDVCLINRYRPAVKMSLHQDRDERDFGHPIVSVSLGLPALFQFGGTERTDRVVRYPLEHGDVVVWGGAARLHYHGISPLRPGEHPVLGATRLNLTFRKAL